MRYFDKISDFSNFILEDLFRQQYGMQDLSEEEISKSERHFKRKVEYLKQFSMLYEPYLFYKGWFHNGNMQKLMEDMSEEETKSFEIDMGKIYWRDYFLKIHIPGVQENVLKGKRPFDLSSTAQILQQLKIPNHTSISDFHLILEHELNKNSWVNTATSSDHSDTDVLFPSIYRLSDEKWAVTLRIHTSTCDRAAALALLRKLLELMSSEKGKGINENEGGGVESELGEKMEVGLGIEEYIPAGKANKPFWARGMDMVGYGLNALRFANLNFIDSESTRGSQVVKLQLNKEDTDRILDGCKTRGIKLCGVLAAAGLIAAHSSKGLPEDQWEKYAVVTLINCRSILDPVLSPDFPGFYHSAILNTHDVKGGEDIWELAMRSYTSFINAKNNNKHFSDMGDLNFLILSDEKWAVTLRIHTSTCDRPAALALLRKLLELMSSEKGKGMNENEGGRVELELRENMEVGLGIEEYIPAGKANKPFWARGIDMVGYGLNALRFANLNFIDSESTRGSQVVKLQLNKEDTDRILDGCKTRGIKLCGVLAAAGLIAAHCSKGLPEDQWEKYAVVTLINCRSILDPVLSPDFPGFYHSAILNTHDVKGGEDIWELAKRSYTSFINAKNNNKHFSDMGDLNFLMCKAIDNPGLTPASSLRTSLISVFEDPVIDNSSTVHQEIGLEDFIGCASVHGVGPSIAIFDTIRDGQLDCACVYPFPLHTREQIQELIGEMKRILVDW
ncbi:fatty acyl-coa reductase 2 [Nicotiana attenuata]|uniref:Fatty acyl-coa reductase 2 n=1 Tax=Nicotiana attenuata TaxID=49451 RepID=A0A1J6IAB1_NICAT|nr:fatty acyl-coa reductase 2 [Nicotiana attenuata]